MQAPHDRVAGQQPAAKKAEASKKSAKRSDESRVAWLDRLREYLREVSYELRKVVWPSRKETIGTTSVVLIIVLICGVYLGIIDYILSPEGIQISQKHGYLPLK